MRSFFTVALLTLFANPVYADEVKSGGKTSTTKAGPNAYSLPAANLPMSKRLDFSVGNSFFRNPWVPADSGERALKHSKRNS
ncbi:hypothetical protein B9J81_17250 [Vibrio sp. V04_P4A5T148]|nr:hypothetical protein B9J81_17250 [Vibrio sp. V04_P4A5T148]